MKRSLMNRTVAITLLLLLPLRSKKGPLDEQKAPKRPPINFTNLNLL